MGSGYVSHNVGFVVVICSPNGHRSAITSARNVILVVNEGMFSRWQHNGDYDNLIIYRSSTGNKFHASLLLAKIFSNLFDGSFLNNKNINSNKFYGLHKIIKIGINIGIIFEATNDSKPLTSNTCQH